MKRSFMMTALVVIAVWGLAACTMPTPAGGGTATPSGGSTAATATTTVALTGTAVMTGTTVTTSTPAMTATTAATATTATTATSGTTATTGTTTTTGTTGTTAITGGAVQVTLREYAVEMPSTLPAGATTFEITNQGSVTHSFKLEGQGMEKGLTQTLAPGQKGTLQVTLAAGTYSAYCPVDGHEGKGMKIEVKVQ